MNRLLVNPVANLTLLFTEVPLLERPKAARAAGFGKIEYWWPFGATGTPATAEVEAFIAAIEDAGVQLVHMNLFGGDMAAGERGVISHPERVEEFAESLEPAMAVALRLGTRLFNVPIGHSRPDLDPQTAFRTASANLALAAARVGEHGGTILLEAVSGMPQYPIKRTEDAIAIIDRVREEQNIGNLAYLFDQFHLVRNGEDVFDSLRRYADYIAHVQIADVPGRGEPGSGEFDFGDWLKLLDDTGYSGPVALEFNPASSTGESLAALQETMMVQ